MFYKEVKMNYRDICPKPKSIMIEPTNRCQLRCPTCFTHKFSRIKKVDLPFEKFKEIINDISPCRSLNLWNFGEPFLHKKIIDMIKYAKDRGIKNVKICTNGMFNQRIIKKIVQSNLDYISFSLDGTTEESYSKFRVGGNFLRVRKNICALIAEKAKQKKERPIVEIQFIVMRHNENEIGEVKKLARNLKVDVLRLKTVLILDKKNLNLLPKNYKFSRYRDKSLRPKVSVKICDIPWSEAVVNADGSVVPCCYVAGGIEKKFIFGNVFDESILDIWNNPRFRKFRQDMLRNKNKIPLCVYCPAKDLDYEVIRYKDTKE